MTVVESRVYVRRRFVWVIPASTEIVLVGDLRDAISMAVAKYQEATGDFPQIPNTENWLRVDWTEDALTFWFEMNEEVGK